MPINKTLIATCAGFGIAIGASVLQPKLIPVAAAAAGGSMMTAGLIGTNKDKEKEQAERAIRVSKALSYCYENFKGLVSPQQLAFHAELEFPQAEKLLESLVTTQNGGQRVDTPMGVVYSFDHPEQILTQLTLNAKAWADNQADEVIRENAVLKQQIQIMSGQVQTLTAAVQARNFVPRASEVARELFQKNNQAPEEEPDPWKNML
jgi:hypothetical protein